MSFIFGGDTGQSQADITDARKRLAMAMLQKGTDTSPISSPWQGAARMAEALMGGLAIRKQADQQKDADAQVMAAITGAPYTPPAPAPSLFGSLFGGGNKSVPASGAQSEIAASSPASTSNVQPGGVPEVADYIRQSAIARGIDPSIALRVAGHEGLNVFDPSKPDNGGDEGSSFGPFQLHYAGMSKSMPRAGLGDDFTAATGLHARDPSTWRQQVDFALDQARKGGWGPWMGAKAEGITGMTGIGALPAAATAPVAPVARGGPVSSPATAPTEVASLDPRAGMAAAAPAGLAVPPPSPSAQPDDFSKVSPDQMQAMLGPQATPGYHDPRVTTAFQQTPAPSPAAQAVQQQAPLPDPQQTAAVDPGASAAPQQPTAAANAPPAARLANALASAPPSPPNPLMSNPKAKALAAAMMNPNASPQVRQMAGVMFQQEMSQGQALYKVQMEQYLKQQDPEYQLNLKKAQYEVDHLGEVSPDTRATLQAQEQKMKFDADQAIRLADHTQQLKQDDPMEQANVAKTTVETANLLNPRMSPAEQAAADLAKQKESFEEGKGVAVPPGQSLVAPGGPNAGKVIFQGTGFAPSEVHDVRKEFESLPTYKAYQQAAPVYQSMVDTAKTDSKASDLNLVYGLGKIMDPNSVVREGEMVMVNNASSLPDWVQGAINAVNGGSRLEPATRTAILNEARSRMGAYRGALDNDVKQYTGIAQRRNMNPEDIIPVLSPIADVPGLSGPNGASHPVTGITNDWQQVAPGVRIRKVN